jgi:hypothetical protein
LPAGAAVSFQVNSTAADCGAVEYYADLDGHLLNDRSA